MSRTSNVFARVEPELKMQAETVLDRLGLPMSSAITLFLNQIVMQNGIPFDVKIPNMRPLVLQELNTEQFSAAIQEGIDDFSAGRTSCIANVAKSLQSDYNL